MSIYAVWRKLLALLLFHVYDNPLGKTCAGNQTVLASCGAMIQKPLFQSWL